MGIFRDSPEEAHLRENINGIANIVGMVDDGRLSAVDLRDLLDAKRPKLQAQYDAVAAKHGAKAPRKLLAASCDIAAISTRRGSAWGARDLMRQVLETLNRLL